MATQTINPLDIYTWNNNNGNLTTASTANGTWTVTTTNTTTPYYTMGGSTTATINPLNGYQPGFIMNDDVAEFNPLPADPWEAAIQKAAQMMKS